jgi:ribosome-binding factor A
LLSELVQKRLGDPRLDLATISQVELSSDLRYGTVYLSILGDAETANAGLRAVRRASNLLRSEMARSLRLRHIPELRFELDERIRAQERIEALLKEAGVGTDAGGVESIEDGPARGPGGSGEDAEAKRE